MDKDERLKLLEDAIVQLKLFVPWAVKTLAHATDQVHDGMYSDDLKHGMSCAEMLEKL